MQKTKRTLSMLLAIIMVIGIFAPFNTTLAAQPTKTNTVNLHKLLMTKEDLKAWNSDEIKEKGYDGTQDLGALGALAGKELKEIAGVYFAWQKKDTDGTWKYISQNGQIIQDQPTTITKQAFDDAEVFGKLTETGGAAFNTTNLEQAADGTEYRIVEVKELSTYKNDGAVLADSKAVPVYITLPLVNDKGVQETIHIYPKNTEDKPEIDKNFARDNNLLNSENAETLTGGADYNNYTNAKAKATAQIGQEIPYEVKTKIPAGTEYKKLTWNDTMTNGLTYTKPLNIAVTPAELTLTPNTDYKLTEDDRGFTLALTDAGLKKVSAITKPVDDEGKSTGAGQDVEFTLKYSAKVNGNAVVDQPDKNNITLDYGNTPGKDIEEKEVTPKDGELQVNKTWSEGDAPTGVNVTYTLKTAGQAVASVSLNGTEKIGTKYNVGEGITFEVTGKHSGKFAGLQGTTYTISERVGGYTPEYTDIQVGSVSVRNNKDTNNPTPLDPTEPEVVTYGKKFVKTDSSTDPKRLAGAEFVIKNKDGQYLAVKSAAEGDAATKAYENAEAAYKKAIADYNTAIAVEGTTEDTVVVTIKEQQYTGKTAIDAQITLLKADRDAKFVKARENYTWVAGTENALVLTSNDKGQFEITGLAKGDYSLEETKAPEGYAKLNEPIPFTVGAGTYNSTGGIDYEPESNTGDAQKVENKKVSIPQTGGIGTLIFGVAGVALMGGAAVAMKKNKEDEEEVE